MIHYISLFHLDHKLSLDLIQLDLLRLRDNLWNKYYFPYRIINWKLVFNFSRQINIWGIEN